MELLVLRINLPLQTSWFAKTCKFHTSQMQDKMDECKCGFCLSSQQGIWNIWVHFQILLWLFSSVHWYVTLYGGSNLWTSERLNLICLLIVYVYICIQYTNRVAFCCLIILDDEWRPRVVGCCKVVWSTDLDDLVWSTVISGGSLPLVFMILWARCLGKSNVFPLM